MQFRDITSYQRGEGDRTPRSVRADIDGWLSITVHRHIHYPPDQWLLSSPGFFENRELKSKDLDSAKSEAIALVSARLKSAIAAIEVQP